MRQIVPREVICREFYGIWHMALSLGRIVLVEDDQDFGSFLCDFLKPQGYEVSFYNSPVQFINELDGNSEIGTEISKGSLPLIISDIQMPEMDGYSFLQRLNKAHPKIPIILMTAFGTNHSEDLAVKHGAFGFLRKPFKLAEIDTLLANAAAHIKSITF